MHANIRPFCTNFIRTSDISKSTSLLRSFLKNKGYQIRNYSKFN